MHLKINRYKGAGLMVAVITLAPGDILPAYSPGHVIGGFLVYGSAAAIVDGVPGEQSSRLGWTYASVDGPWLDAWEDRARVRGKGLLHAGDAGAQWVCLTSLSGAMPTVTPQQLEGRLTIPAGNRLVVARGILEFDHQQGEQGNLFAARATDLDAAGAADILLLS